MKLWYGPRTRAFTALWMMEEAGLPYALERVDIRAAGHPSDALKAVNPMGKLPALEDGDAKLGETAAILLYVAEKVPGKKLAPPIGDPRRGRFLQWLMFSGTCIEPAMMERMHKTPVNSLQSGWGDYDRVVAALRGAMQPDRWLVGDDFTAADLYIASSLGFGMQFGLIDKLPEFEAFVARAGARDAYRRAQEIEAREGGA
jgi:glutathione S-transferase